jgi:hypothetical protein
MLDTNVVRHIGAKKCDLSSFIHYAKQGGSIHLADGSVAELVRQLDDGEFEWPQWERAREALSQFLDRSIPIMMGGRELLGAAHISLCAAVPSMTMRDQVRLGRQLWHVLRLATNVDDLRTNGIAVELSDQPAIVVLEIFRTTEIMLEERREWWRSFQHLQRAGVDQGVSVRGRGFSRLELETQVRELGAFIDARSTASIPPVSTRLDAMIRVHCLLTLRSLQEKQPYNAKKKANDKFDHDLLRYLALPAAICTADTGLITYLRDSHSWQVKWVVQPHELLVDHRRQALLNLSWPSQDSDAVRTPAA